MSSVKVLTLKNGAPSSIDSTNDSIAAKSVILGGTGGTELTKTAVDSLIGSTDASSLHNHNTQYYTKSEIDAMFAAITSIDGGAPDSNYSGVLVIDGGTP